ncbi:MAG: O-antigen ligase family protein, partial [Planctomycetota bacterium]
RRVAEHHAAGDQVGDDSEDEKFGRTQRRGARRRGWPWLFVGGVLGGGLLALYVMGNNELTETAPASLRFRLQYWEATLDMAADRPWLGAGPGQFQSLYNHYRDIAAAEQVADPHHWFFETLATGGYPAASLLLVAMMAGTLLVLGRRPQSTQSVADAASVDEQPAKQTRGEDQSGPPTQNATILRSIVTGVLAALLIGGLFRLLFEYTPPVPEIIGALVLVGFAGLMHGVAARLDRLEINRALLDWALPIITLAVLLNLSIAGGWTVPGVIFGWWLAAAWTLRIGHRPSTSRADVESQSDLNPGRQRLVGAIVLCLLGVWYWSSMLPMQQRSAVDLSQTWPASSRAMTDPASARAAFQSLVEEHNRGVQADPLWPAPLATLCETQRNAVIVSSMSEVNDLVAALVQSQTRWIEHDVHNSDVYRACADQMLHVYQCHGRIADLQRATMLYRQAYQRSPATETLPAQIALILATHGGDADSDPSDSEDQDPLVRAKELAETA